MTEIELNVYCPTLEFRGSGKVTVSETGLIYAETSIKEEKDKIVIFVGNQNRRNEKRSKTITGRQKNCITGSIVSGGSIHIGDSTIVQNGEIVRSQPVTQQEKRHRLKFSNVYLTTIIVSGLDDECTDKDYAGPILELVFEQNSLQFRGDELSVVANNSSVCFLQQCINAKVFNVVAINSYIDYRSSWDNPVGKTNVSLVELWLRQALCCVNFSLTALRNSSITVRSRNYSPNVFYDESSKVQLKRTEHD